MKRCNSSAQYDPSKDPKISLQGLYVHPLGWSTSGGQGGFLSPEQMLAIGRRLTDYALERIMAEYTKERIK